MKQLVTCVITEARNAEWEEKSLRKDYVGDLPFAAWKADTYLDTYLQTPH